MTITGFHVAGARGLLGRSSTRRADWGDGGSAAPARARPERRYGVDGGGHGIGRLLVVDPPADEVRPCIGRVALDREVNLAHPGYRVEELLVAQADSAAWVGLIGHID